MKSPKPKIRHSTKCIGHWRSILEYNNSFPKLVAVWVLPITRARRVEYWSKRGQSPRIGIFPTSSPYHRCDLLVPLTIPTGFTVLQDTIAVAMLSPPTIDCVRKGFIYFLQLLFYFSPDQLKVLLHGTCLTGTAAWKGPIQFAEKSERPLLI